jgi:hypothetical protein
MNHYQVSRGDAHEGEIAAARENLASHIPSSAYFAMALGSMAVSAALQAAHKKHAAMFFGQWAAPFMLLGIYNKLAGTHGPSVIPERRASQRIYAHSV